MPGMKGKGKESKEREATPPSKFYTSKGTIDTKEKEKRAGKTY